MAEKKISVIIPVYNRARMVIRCVNSVLSQNEKDVEIIVIDDGSTDDTWDEIQRIKGLRILRHEKRRGRGAARNTGIKASRGKLLVFLDSDCWAGSSDWLSHHVRAHESRDESVVSGMVKGWYRTYGGGVFSYLNWFMFMGKKMAPYVPMANVSVLRDIFDRVGPFETRMPVYEDNDWYYRAVEKGIPYRFAREAVVYHENREGLSAVWNHQRQFGEYTIPLRRSYPKSAYTWIFPKTMATSIVMCLPLAFLMTIYKVCKALPRDPRVIWYAPGILFGHLGYSWGIIKYFLNIKATKTLSHEREGGHS